MAITTTYEINPAAGTTIFNLQQYGSRLVEEFIRRLQSFGFRSAFRPCTRVTALRDRQYPHDTHLRPEQVHTVVQLIAAVFPGLASGRNEAHR